MSPMDGGPTRATDSVAVVKIKPRRRRQARAPVVGAPHRRKHKQRASGRRAGHCTGRGGLHRAIHPRDVRGGARAGTEAGHGWDRGTCSRPATAVLKTSSSAEQLDRAASASRARRTRLCDGSGLEPAPPGSLRGDAGQSTRTSSAGNGRRAAGPVSDPRAAPLRRLSCSGDSRDSMRLGARPHATSSGTAEGGMIGVRSGLQRRAGVQPLGAERDREGHPPRDVQLPGRRLQHRRQDAPVPGLGDDRQPLPRLDGAVSNGVGRLSAPPRGLRSTRTTSARPISPDSGSAKIRVDHDRERHGVAGG